MNNMYDILSKINLLESKGSKPDFLDLDKDGDKSEPMKKAANEVDEGSTGDYSAKKARAGDDIQRPRHPQELDYQAGPEDDAQYRRHHGLDDPLRKRERKLRATDHKTLDRLERQAFARAKQIDEEPNEGNEFSGELAKAKATGQKEFEVDGKTYPVKESRSQGLVLVREAATDTRSVKIYHDREYDEFTVCLAQDGTVRRMFAERRSQAMDIAREWLSEGRNDPSPLDDPITRFRKKFAPSVMRDPEARSELSKLDTEYGERRKTAYGRGEEEGDDDEDGSKKDKPAGKKRGRGRPKKYTADRPRQERVTARSRKTDRTSWTPDRKKRKVKEQDMAEDYGREELDEISNKRGYDNAYEVHGNRFGYYVWRKSPISQVLNIGITDPGLTGLTDDDPRSSGIQNFVKQNMEPVSFNSLSPGIKKLILNQLPLRSTRQQNADSVSSDGNRINYDIPGNERWASIDAERTKNRALKQKLKQNMGMTEDYDQDEYDEEGEMAKTEARTIEDAARELQSILDDQENLPEWVQKKISLAKDYVDRARDYMKANRPEDEGMVAEKAVSKAQRRAAGIAYAAQKGDIPKSELRGASKEMAKMAGGELKKFAKTKEKGLPQKKTEEVEETTTAGNVAVSAEAPKGGKKGMQFGKGVYEARLAEQFAREMESIMNEGLDVSVTANADGSNTVSVTGKDVAPDVLMDLLKMAGMSGSREEVYQPIQVAPGSNDISGMLDTLDGIAGGDQDQPDVMIPEQEMCEVCGGHEGMHEAGCGRGMTMEANLANSADNTEIMDTDYMVDELAGGLNGPKLHTNPNNPGDNPLAMRSLGTKNSPNLNLGAMAEEIRQEKENHLIELYKRIS